MSHSKAMQINLTLLKHYLVALIIQIFCGGQRQLGAAIGTRSFTESYVSKQVKMWPEEIPTLSSIAEIIPIVCTVLLPTVSSITGAMLCIPLNQWVDFFNHLKKLFTNTFFLLQQALKKY